MASITCEELSVLGGDLTGWMRMLTTFSQEFLDQFANWGPLTVIRLYI